MVGGGRPISAHRAAPLRLERDGSTATTLPSRNETIFRNPIGGGGTNTETAVRMSSMVELVMAVVALASAVTCLARSVEAYRLRQAWRGLRIKTRRRVAPAGISKHNVAVGGTRPAIGFKLRRTC